MDKKEEGDLTGIFRQYQHVPQQTAIGCGVCSVLMAISAVNKDFEPNASMERSWLKKLRRMRGAVPTFEIMRMVDSFGLKMSIWFEGSLLHQDKNDPLVSNYLKSLHYFQRKGSIIKHQENIRIDEKIVISAIQQGGIVLLNGTVHGTPHMRVCVGYTNTGIIIADPLENYAYTVTPNQFGDYFSPPYGKWIMSVASSQTEHRQQNPCPT